MNSGRGKERATRRNRAKEGKGDLRFNEHIDNELK